MTQPLDLSKLARKAARKERTWPNLKEPFESGTFILSALTKLAALKDEEKQRFVNRLAKALDDLAGHKAALKIATDALEESGRTIATLRKLTPEKAKPTVLMPDGQEVTHREMSTITQDQIVAALQQIKELLP